MCNDTWFTFQKMLRLKTSDLRDRRKDMSTVSGGTFNTVTVINTTIASLLVNVKLYITYVALRTVNERATFNVSLKRQGHFRDASFQVIDCTSTDSQT